MNQSNAYNGFLKNTEEIDALMNIYPKFLEVLTGISANKVRDYIYDKVGYYPWLFNKISANALNFDSNRCTERNYEY